MSSDEEEKPAEAADDVDLFAETASIDPAQWHAAEDAEDLEETMVVDQLLCRDRYRLDTLLGAGGMGQVWLCFDMVAQRKVALKKVPAKYAQDEGLMKKILENFQIIGKLKHQYIGAVNALEQDPETGEYFLIMEYIPGKDLLAILQENDGPLPLENVVRYTRQIAQALDYGHKRGVIHRDIKPENVIISSEEGDAKVLDYGIASEYVQDDRTVTLLDAAVADGQSGGANMVGVSGTPFYMSPEQWEPVPQDHRTDQYSLAASVYHLLSGQRAFQNVGRVTGALRSAVMHDAPERIQGVSDPVWEVLMRGLAKAPRDRFGSCSEFAEALAAAAAPAGGRKSGTFPWLYVGVAVCLAIGAVAFGLRSKHVQRGEATAENGTEGATNVASVLPAEAAMKYFALVIGINQYQAGWPTLKNAVNDAQRVETLLRDDYAFDGVTALYDQDATKANIMTELERIAIQMTASDCVVIYHAGHGEVDETAKEGFWIPYDGLPIGENGRRNQSWIANWILARYLEASNARHILVLADSCYAGSIFSTRSIGDKVSLQEMIGKASRYVIASGSADQKVLDGEGEHSPFNNALFAYMSQPPKEMYTSLELAAGMQEDYLEEASTDLTQGPLFRSFDGQFVFVKKGTTSLVPAAVPDAQMPQNLVSDTAFQAVPALEHLGHTNVATRLLSKYTALYPEQVDSANRLRELDQARATQQQTVVNELIEYLADHQPKVDPELAAQQALFPGPRVLALMEIKDEVGGEQSRIAAIRMEDQLEGALLELDGFHVVDRQHLEKVLQEQKLEAAGLTDERLASQVGKILPASLLMTGNLVAEHDGLFVTVRVFETKTSKLLKHFTGKITAENKLEDEVKRLASEIRATLSKERPLVGKVQASSVEGEVLGYAGEFHGVTSETSFDVLEFIKIQTPIFDEVRKTKVGTATVKNLGTYTTDLNITWDKPGDHNLEQVWIQEVSGK